METILACLISKQTIPNILSIYHFQPDSLIFISTEKMQKDKKNNAIIETLKLLNLDYTNKTDEIIVNQDCLIDCEENISLILSKYDLSSNKFILNLTGGTKIMALAAFNQFKDISNDNIKMIYTPIPKNEFIEIYPDKNKCKKPESFNLKLNVQQYVTAYNTKISNIKQLESIKQYALEKQELCQYIVNNYDNIISLLSSFSNNLRVKRKCEQYLFEYNYTPENNEEEFLKNFGFEIADGKISKILIKDDIKFLTGDWLSLYAYNEIKDIADDCLAEVFLKSNKDTENEFDVLFTKNNALYLVECKTLSQSHDKDGDILYKIYALQQDFGLRPEGLLVSASKEQILKNDEIKESLKKRAKQCNTKIIHPAEIKNLKEWVKKEVK